MRTKNKDESEILTLSSDILAGGTNCLLLAEEPFITLGQKIK